MFGIGCRPQKCRNEPAEQAPIATRSEKYFTKNPLRLNPSVRPRPFRGLSVAFPRRVRQREAPGCEGLPFVCDSWTAASRTSGRNNRSNQRVGATAAAFRSSKVCRQSLIGWRCMNPSRFSEGLAKSSCQIFLPNLPAESRCRIYRLTSTELPAEFPAESSCRIYRLTSLRNPDDR